LEQPRFRLNFQFGELLKLDRDIEIKISESSTIVLGKSDNPTSKDPNRGSLIFQVDTLDYYRAKEIGKKQIEDFLNLFIVISKIEIPPATFADEPILLNPEKFEGQTKTRFISFTGNAFIIAKFDDVWVEKTIGLIGKANRLTDEQKQAIIDSFFWLRKTTNARSASENFVYRWISLEALCGILKGKIPETTVAVIKCLMDKITNESAQGIFENHREVIGELAKADLKRGTKQPNKELKDAMDALDKNPDYKEVIKKTALCVYEVRNKLFHRGLKSSLVEKSNPLLRDLILKTLEDFLLKL
jgi:hypothetical protein